MTMMMFNKKITYLLGFFLLLSGFVSYAQKDSLVGLGSSPVLQKKYTPEVNETNSWRLMTTGGDTIELPFYDDFSYAGPYPDSTKWMKSKSVYVNRHFARNPRTLGVATFDGLKATGYPYKPFGSSSTENSDTLTSKYIRLDSVTTQFVAITPADSVYLSFHYQPRGFGLHPGVPHTLILDFFNPTTQTWVTKLTLSRTGGTSTWQAKDSVFTLVMVPITDPQFFKKDFRFRFRNKSAGTGSVNNWHIDNVYLSKDRGRTDTTLRDLSYAFPANTFLEKYTAMPYNQYTGASQMAANSRLKIRNNDVTPSNFTGFISIKDNINNVVLYDTTGADNALPFYPNGYVSNPDITDPLNSTVSPLISNFSFNNGNTLSDSITYAIKHYFSSPASDINKANDTIVYKQIFHNYFSYDDGSAELGYFLNEYGAKTAVKYNMTNTDVLRAIDIYFDPIPINGVSVAAISTSTFGLRVWGDAGGVPGSILYDDNNTTDRNPNFYQWGPVNYFKRYFLNYPLNMSSGTFYVGIEQEDAIGLNVGFDQNTNTQSMNFYNLSGTWAQNSYKGSLMIRPVFGDSTWAATGIKQEPSKATTIMLYPNPASDKLFVKTNAPFSNLSIELIDALGKTQVKEQIADGQAVSLTALEQGFYFVRVYSENQLIKVQKIIVTH